jgi:hypothetical protein
MELHLDDVDLIALLQIAETEELLQQLAAKEDDD